MRVVCIMVVAHANSGSCGASGVGRAVQHSAAQHCAQDVAMKWALAALCCAPSPLPRALGLAICNMVPNCCAGHCRLEQVPHGLGVLWVPRRQEGFQGMSGGTVAQSANSTTAAVHCTIMCPAAVLPAGRVGEGHEAVHVRWHQPDDPQWMNRWFHALQEETERAMKLGARADASVLLLSQNNVLVHCRLQEETERAMKLGARADASLEEVEEARAAQAQLGADLNQARLCRLLFSGVFLVGNASSWLCVPWLRRPQPGAFSLPAARSVFIMCKLQGGLAQCLAQSPQMGRRLEFGLNDNMRPLCAGVVQVLLRRTKALIAHQLPRKRDHIVFCALSELQLAAYK